MLQYILCANTLYLLKIKWMIKKLNYITWMLIVLVGISSCKTGAVATTNDTKSGQLSDATSIQNRHLNDIALNGKVYSAIWQQNAGEFRALCYQAYNVATRYLDLEMANNHQRPLAIITDVDETFLDNSPYAVTQALVGNEFDNKSWMEWTAKGEAIAFPGSVDFFNHAAAKGIEVFYITNRSTKELEGTRRNLKNLGFPFADDVHLMMMDGTSDKETRRLAVLEKYEVIMYLGDNLNDFSKVFYKLSQADRNQKTDELAAEFGSKFIVLPNSGYGNWESAIPGYNSHATPVQKDSIFLNSLKKY